MPSIVSPTDLEILRRRLSPERLSPYLGASAGDLSAALDLYAWNAEAVAALSMTIGHVEVLLRNAMHDQLTVWSADTFGEPAWYLDPGHILRPKEREDIQTARTRATRRGQVETPGRVIAELSLGFWRFLLAGAYDRTAWRSALRHAFPAGIRRRKVYEAVETLHLARNRMAHHESMFNRPLGSIRATAMELTGWICPVGRRWVEQQCRTAAVLRRRPENS